MFCSKCGQKLNSNNKCINPNCQSKSINDDAYFYYDKVHEFDEVQPYIREDLVTEEDVSNFVGYKNTDYYLGKWNIYLYNENFFSWNWAAFFFSWVWLDYRKMYKLGTIVFFLPSAIAAISARFLPPTIATIVIPILDLTARIIVAIIANKEYMKHINKNVGRIKTSMSTADKEVIARRLVRAGGITWTPVIIVICIYVLCIILGAYAFYLAFDNLKYIYF